MQFSFILIGILTMLLTVAPAWGYMIAIALGMGLFDGCFISLIGPIAFDLCGPTGGAQGIGFLLGLFSIPMTLGPPLAGMMYDSMQSYFWPFLLSGLPPIIGGLLLFLVRCVPTDPMDASEIIASKVARDAQEAGHALVDPTAATGADGEHRVGEGTSLLAQDPGSGGGVNTNSATLPPNYIERESNC
ncbi:hypothetical protein B566_EDAN017345 [Ephemera danica]|nr:hypothetical protein B566_EDAN017345 [Ephemera danica]